MNSPKFKFDELLNKDEICNLKSEADFLRKAVSRNEKVVVYGRRNMGKTSLLKNVIAEEFAHVKGIEQIIIFGSWAARYAGVVGQAPNDIDVLVLGKPNYSQLSEACARAQDRIGKQINAIDRGMSWWTNKSADPLKKEIKRRPYLTI